MSADRYVVLGLAHVRSPWFREVSRWATAAVVPVEFVKCVSIDELRARLASGRSFSAIVVDAGLPGVDRDLVDQARELGCAVIAVTDGRAGRDLVALGVAAVLPDGFDRGLLLAVLDEHASPIGSTAVDASFADRVDPAPVAVPAGWRGRLVAVVGAGGTGTSVIAMSLAAGLAADVRSQGRVALADLCLHADQAVLHDARDIVPGLQELVEAHRHGVPTTDEVLALTFGVGHPYRVVLGLRRHRDWTALRPRAVHAALDGLRATFTHLVCDLEPDLEGEAECGSFDVEERNLLARTAIDQADVVVVTARPDVQGLHRLVRLLADLLDRGIPPDRIVTVVNRAPRAARARAEITRAVAALLDPAVGTAARQLASPIFVAEHRRLDAALRDGTGVPAALGVGVSAAVLAAIDRPAAAPAAAATPAMAPVAVAPGSLGSWAQEATG